MALLSAPGALPRRAENLGCVMCSLGLTDHKPTARPSASSSRPCANGPTAFLIDIPWSAPLCSAAGCITTIGIARTTESAASRRSAAWLSPETTSWRFTASSPSDFTTGLYRASLVARCAALMRVRFASRSQGAGQPNGSRIEGRGGPATKPAMMSADQAIGKLGGAVLPDIQRLLDRGLIFELELRSI